MKQDCSTRDEVRAQDAVCRDWPLRSGLPLGPIPTAVPCARAHAAQILWEWGMSKLNDSVALVVSELITNAVTASCRLDGGPFPVRYWLLSDRKRVLVLVWDASPAPPVRLSPDECTEGGRGLMLVEAMSAEWNWYPAPWDRLEGKVVWALLA